MRGVSSDRRRIRKRCNGYRGESDVPEPDIFAEYKHVQQSAYVEALPSPTTTGGGEARKSDAAAALHIISKKYRRKSDSYTFSSKRTGSNYVDAKRMASLPLKLVDSLTFMILFASFPARTFWLLSNCFMGSSMRFNKCLDSRSRQATKRKGTRLLYCKSITPLRLNVNRASRKLNAVLKKASRLPFNVGHSRRYYTRSLRSIAKLPKAFHMLCPCRLLGVSPCSRLLPIFTSCPFHPLHGYHFIK